MVFRMAAGLLGWFALALQTGGQLLDKQLRS